MGYYTASWYTFLDLDSPTNVAESLASRADLLPVLLLNLKRDDSLKLLIYFPRGGQIWSFMRKNFIPVPDKSRVDNQED